MIKGIKVTMSEKKKFKQSMQTNVCTLIDVVLILPINQTMNYRWYITVILFYYIILTLTFLILKVPQSLSCIKKYIMHKIMSFSKS